VTYNVRLSPPAVRAYHHLDPSIRSQIQTGLDALRSHPTAGPKVKRLKGRLRDYYRYRIGDYRIVYTIVQREHAVYVDYIQHRKDIYRRME
jgi:mRNA interferase RelE/StbE